jgi:hypothetical protein
VRRPRSVATIAARRATRGYRCRVERSNGTTQYLLSADAKLGVPYPLVLAVPLGIGGAVAIGRGRR